MRLILGVFAFVFVVVYESRRTSDPDIQPLNPPSLCSASEMGNGKWRFNNALAAHTCCGWDEDQGKNPECKTQNRIQVGGCGCACQANTHLFEYVEPHECKLVPWNASEFCRALGGRKMIFVGDSIQQQQFYTVHEQVRRDNGPCAEDIMFEHSDNLDGVNYRMVSGGNPRGKTLDVIVAEYVSRFPPNKLLFAIGLGAWLVRPQHDALLVYRNLVTKYSSLLQEQGVPFIWFTQPPGHQNCLGRSQPADNQTAVLASFNEEEEWPLSARSKDKTKGDYYHWKNAYYFKDELLRIVGPERTINSFDPLFLRWDGHTTIECEHYCVFVFTRLIPTFIHHMLHIHGDRIFEF